MLFGQELCMASRKDSADFDRRRGEFSCHAGTTPTTLGPRWRRAVTTRWRGSRWKCDGNDEIPYVSRVITQWKQLRTMQCDDVMSRLMECSGSGNAMHCSFGMACRMIFPTSPASSCPVSTRLKRRRPSTAILLFSSLKDLAHMKVAGDNFGGLKYPQVTMGFNTNIV